MPRVGQRRDSDERLGVVGVDVERPAKRLLGAPVVRGLAGAAGGGGRGAGGSAPAPTVSAGGEGGGGVRPHPSCEQQPLHGFCCPFALSNPLGGMFSYRKTVRVGTALPSTPSPRRSPA